MLVETFQAAILGIVEGLTEFLPISSTAHLMLTLNFLGLEPTNFTKTFEIAIQLGAILAVVVLYWDKLLINAQIFKRVALAFIPTGIIGLICYRFVVDELLENHAIALAALFIGGIAMILLEKLLGDKKTEEIDLAQISYQQCVLIGVFQAIAIIPGVSRAAATILGGMILGLPRKAAVEFSFLLAVPTMTAATALALYKNIGEFTHDQLGSLTVGFVTSLIVAILAIKFLLRFIRTHTFIPFGIYRMVLVVLILSMIYLGIYSLN